MVGLALAGTYTTVQQLPVGQQRRAVSISVCSQSMLVTLLGQLSMIQHAMQLEVMRTCKGLQGEVVNTATPSQPRSPLFTCMNLSRGVCWLESLHHAGGDMAMVKGFQAADWGIRGGTGGGGGRGDHAVE